MCKLATDIESNFDSLFSCPNSTDADYVAVYVATCHSVICITDAPRVIIQLSPQNGRLVETTAV